MSIFFGFDCELNVLVDVVDMPKKQDPFGDRIDKYVDSLRSKARDAQNSPNVDMFGFADVDGIIDQTEEQLRGATGKLFEDFDEFEELEDFANDPWDLDGPTEEEIQIDRQWLQKLFRRTARVLHPDRDSNHENYQSRLPGSSSMIPLRMARIAACVRS